MVTHPGIIEWLVEHPELINNRPPQLGRRDSYNSIYASGPVSEDRQFTYVVFYGGAQIAMMVVAGLLVAFCALLTGLTLAVCGLDMNYLHLRSVTGTPKERRQALEVIRMKRHGTWLLCSLVLVAVGCSQSFPFVIQSIWHGQQVWVPILVSTLTMAIFVEILPQYMIPKQAIAWGYYCWPVIWGCMWATCPITYPTAWLLDKIHTKKDEYGIFKNNELAAVIQYHEESKKRGGKLGQDTARIMTGALKLDSVSIDGNTPQTPDSSSEDSEEDLEKANSAFCQRIIVKWSVVKTVDINDVVDEAFIKKVQGWSYSRIPVIGKPGKGNSKESFSLDAAWEGTEVYGFLHIRNLVGLNIKNLAKSENRLTVKDLALYPIPIVRDDMLVYELLNLFQMGMARIAIIVHEAQIESFSTATVRVKGDLRSTLWTATEKTNTHLMSKLKGGKGKQHWTMDYLRAAEAAAAGQDQFRQNCMGIRCPQPLGIVTFEDIIDTILQKTSRDERDFFDRDTSSPPTKFKKVGDYSPHVSESGQNLPRSPKRAHVTFEKSVNPGTLRRRSVSNKNRGPTGLDGANDRSIDDNIPSSIRLPKRRKSTRSSYTDDSDGGFHGPNESSASLDYNIAMTAEEFAELANTSSSDCPGNPYSHVKTASLPTRRSNSAISEDAKQPLRHVSAALRILELRRVSLFSRGSSSFEKELQAQEYQEMDESSELTIPVPSTAPGQFRSVDLQPRYNPNISRIHIEKMEDTLEHVESQGHTREKSGETASLMSWSSDDDAHHMTHVYDTFSVLAGGNLGPSLVHNNSNKLCAITREKEQHKPYDGFPPELLDITNKGNRVPDFVSRTLPRSVGNEISLQELAEKGNKRTPTGRESSFHDDRALLPSQRRLLGNSSRGLGTRSSSLWF